MNFDLRPFLGLEVLLALAVVAMLVWRRAIARSEDDSLHVLQGDTLVQQTTMAHKLETIDKWGKILTVIAVAFGLVLAGLYVYQVWMLSTRFTTGA